MKKSELRYFIRNEVKKLDESINKKTPEISIIRKKMHNGYQALSEIQQWIAEDITPEIEKMGYKWGEDWYFDILPTQNTENVVIQLIEQHSIQMLFEFNSSMSQQQFENILKKSGIKKSNYQIAKIIDNKKINVIFINKQ